MGTGGERGVRPTSGPPCSLECEFKLLGPVGRMGRDGGAPVEVGGLALTWVSQSGPGTGSVALGQSSQDIQTQPTPSQKTICSSLSRELSGSQAPAASTLEHCPFLLFTTITRVAPATEVLGSPTPALTHPPDSAHPLSHTSQSPWLSAPELRPLDVASLFREASSPGPHPGPLPQSLPLSELPRASPLPDCKSPD